MLVQALSSDRFLHLIMTSFQEKKNQDVITIRLTSRTAFSNYTAITESDIFIGFKLNFMIL